jgi:hypothetical protein
MPSENRVEFEALPPKVKAAVGKILEHNKRVRLTSAGCAVGITGPTAIFVGAALKEGAPGKAVGVIGSAMGAFGLALSYGLLKSHDKQFKLEYLQLFRTLKAEKENSAIKGLVEKFPFLAVDMKGNIVGKKHAPRIRRLPIGRRRVASPKAGKPIIRKWRKKYLPK